MKDEFNILIAGLGGQGIISAGHILSRASIREGLNFRTFGSYGMAQRGGSVCLHFRIGDVHSPKITEGTCDLLVGFELMEGLRNAHFMDPSGTIVLNNRLVLPPGSIDSKIDRHDFVNFLKQRFSGLILLDIEQKLGPDSIRGLNVALLGAAFANGQIPISLENMRYSVGSYSKTREEFNLSAFELGYREFK